MEELFQKFHTNHIREIHAFLNSDSDILYISGFSGCGKSSVLKSSLETYENKILKFHHLCFPNTVTDDFLLSFYDTFRNYALKQAITLKKNPEEEFVQKVNFYFKNLEHRAVVIIDNFETVSENKEITDLLIHICGFENVKLIIISKEDECELIENPTISIERILFDKIDFNKFQEVLSICFEDPDAELFQKFYNAAEGHELYLKMALTYLSSLNLALSDLISEFEEKNISFGDFITEKQISLIPDIYYPILRNLACILHNVHPSFIEAYGLGDVKQIPYLFSKFIISEFYGTYSIKSYLRQYFLENASLKDKVAIYKTIISVYETELSKSPKDRLLRLSRESIRNQIGILEEKIPRTQKIESMPVYNYNKTPIENTANWFITGGANSAGRKMPGMSPRKKNIRRNENFDNPHFDKAMKEAAEFIENYKYKEAMEPLERAKKFAREIEEKRNAYLQAAEVLIKLNNNNGALLNISELAKICKTANDNEGYAKCRIEAGKIYKKLYAFSKAKSCFSEIKDVSDETLSEAKIALAEIYELENDRNNAIKEYLGAYELLQKSTRAPEIAYKLGVLYDEDEYYEEALEFYANSINLADETGSSEYLVKAYTNSGIILSDMGRVEDALSYLEYAFELSKSGEDYRSSYYIARDIADIYRNIEPEKAYDYLTYALDYAKMAESPFEIAISLLELGDFYYNSKQNEQALICYFQAKNTLGNKTSKENLERVTTRINDMKIKLGEYIFNGMKALYDRD